MCPSGRAMRQSMIPLLRQSPVCAPAICHASCTCCVRPPRTRCSSVRSFHLLANREILKQVVKALTAFGARATGQLVDALLDPATPDIVRRRLPFVLKSCASSLARDGLVQALATSSFEVRLRCGRALLALTDKHPELALTAACRLPGCRARADGPQPLMPRHASTSSISWLSCWSASRSTSPRWRSTPTTRTCVVPRSNISRPFFRRASLRRWLRDSQRRPRRFSISAVPPCCARNCWKRGRRCA